MIFNGPQYHEIECRGRSSCFETLSDNEIGLLEQSKLIVQYKKGEIIAKQGTSNTDIIYLQNGYVKLYKEFSNTRSLSLIEQECNFIGLYGLFVETTMQYTLVALTDVIVCSFNKHFFESLMQKNNLFALEILHKLNTKTLNTFNNLFNSSSKQMHGRLAWALLELSENVFTDNSLRIPITRKDLSEFTNMSVMSVGRILREFAEDNLIVLKKNHIRITDKERLLIACKNG
jgi:CRP/FNR family transcriptional regulator